MTLVGCRAPSQDGRVRERMETRCELARSPGQRDRFHRETAKRGAAGRRVFFKLRRVRAASSDSAVSTCTPPISKRAWREGRGRRHGSLWPQLGPAGLILRSRGRLALSERVHFDLHGHWLSLLRFSRGKRLSDPAAVGGCFI